MTASPHGLSEIVAFVHAEDGFRLAVTELVLDAPAPLGAPAFLMIHGFAQNRRALAAGAIPRLLIARGARVFLGELRGHGRSAVLEGDPRAWSLATHLDHDLPALVARACSIAGVSRVHLVGHSMGGMIGVAALARPSLRDAIASLTAFATPVVFGGSHSPLVRLAAMVAAPALRRAATVPMDFFLRTLAPLLVARGRRTPMRALFEIIALASARTADAEMLTEILASSEEESALVLAELAEMATRGRAAIAGIDLLTAARGSSLPLAFIVGTHDVLAPRTAVAGLDRGEGPRLLVEIADALHVDLVVGRHAAELVEKLWAFLF